MNERMKAIVADLRAVSSILKPHPTARTHESRLEAFYGPQSDVYDSFRQRLLFGREALLGKLTLPPGGSMLDLGGGTGSNIEALGERRAMLKAIEIVDLCPALLKIAQRRVSEYNWVNVYAVEGDATTFNSVRAPYDIVLFSYSLTMIPNWFQAIDNAWRLLKPGGVLAAVDFYTSRKWPAEGMKRHSFITRALLPAWFSYSNVFISSEHLPYLSAKFPVNCIEERQEKLPYAFGLRAPYYLFWGTKV